MESFGRLERPSKATQNSHHVETKTSLSQTPDEDDRWVLKL